MDIPQVLAIWLHTLALVIVLGYYGILGRVVLPALRRSLDGPAQRATLVAIERRALPLVLLAVALFIVTGAYLLLVDPQYAGLGNVLASTWTKLMLAKHVLVVVLVVLGVIVDRLIRGLAEAPTDAAGELDLRLVQLGAEAATGLGALIVLLTAVAQLST